MKTILLSACCFLWMHYGIAQKPAPVKEKDKLLAGKTFAVELVEKDAKKKAKPYSDEISFKGGKMHSNYMKAETKFLPASYEISVDALRENGAIAFVSESQTADGEALTWEGITMPDGSAEGTVKLSKKGKIKKEYTFSGTLKTKIKK